MVFSVVLPSSLPVVLTACRGASLGQEGVSTQPDGGCSLARVEAQAQKRRPPQPQVTGRSVQTLRLRSRVSLFHTIPFDSLNDLPVFKD